MRRTLTIGLMTIPLLVAALAGSGCTSIVLGSSAATGVAIAQQRSVGDAIDDATIHAQIWDGLISDSEVLFRKVGVEVIEGRVLLTGVVAEPEDRVDAVRVTWTVGGVKEVLNEIEVRDSGSFKDYASDVWITTQLRTKMLRDGKVSDVNYSVETINGVVFLIGIARDQGELDRVTSHARNISGVSKVVSHVVLADDPRRT